MFLNNINLSFLNFLKFLNNTKHLFHDWQLQGHTVFHWVGCSLLAPNCTILPLFRFCPCFVIHRPQNIDLSWNFRPQILARTPRIESQWVPPTPLGDTLYLPLQLFFLLVDFLCCFNFSYFKRDLICSTSNFSKISCPFQSYSYFLRSPSWWRFQRLTSVYIAWELSWLAPQ